MTTVTLSDTTDTTTTNLKAGDVLTLHYDPEMTNVGTDGGVEWRAEATGQDGERYQVYWDHIDGDYDGNDYSDAADWDNPSRVTY